MNAAEVGDKAMATKNLESEQVSLHFAAEDHPDAAEFIHAANKLRETDEKTYVLLVRELAKQTESTANPGPGEAHPLAHLAGALRDLPGWEEDKATMLKMREKSAKL